MLELFLVFVPEFFDFQTTSSVIALASGCYCVVIVSGVNGADVFMKVLLRLAGYLNIHGDKMVLNFFCHKFNIQKF